MTYPTLRRRLSAARSVCIEQVHHLHLNGTTGCGLLVTNATIGYGVNCPECRRAWPQACTNLNSKCPGMALAALTL